MTPPPIPDANTPQPKAEGQCAEKDCTQAAKFGSIWCQEHYNQHWYPKLPPDSINEPTSSNPSPSEGLKKATTPDLQLDAATEAEIERVFEAVRWGDYQDEKGNWCHGVANQSEIKAALTRLLLLQRQEARIEEVDNTRFIWPGSVKEPKRLENYRVNRIAKLQAQLEKEKYE